MVRGTLKDYDVMSVGETGCVTPETAYPLVKEGDDMLNMVFHFEMAGIARDWSLDKIRDIQKRWYDGLWGKGWSSQYLGNHDQPRQVSIFGNDRRFRVQSAKLLGTMLHTLPGTPYLYQGDEIGMTNSTFSSIEQFRDVNAKFSYSEMRKKGMTDAEAIAWLNRYSRDHSRTPMQWDDGLNAGFTEGDPWIGVNPNYKRINVSSALKNPDSIFYHYKKLIALRKKNPVMVYGQYRDLTAAGAPVYAYTRSLEGSEWLVLLNMSDESAVSPVSPGGEILSNNYALLERSGDAAVLAPWQAVIIAR
jgi:oligo-1,6-glucosidase